MDNIIVTQLSNQSADDNIYGPGLRQGKLPTLRDWWWTIDISKAGWRCCFP